MDKKQKYNYQDIENKWKKKWNDNNTYTFTYDESKPTYVVDTPPPYVSADHLHSGHIMSYSQAEFVVRYKRMKGFNVFYPMGFDDNGLPTERFVEKKYNIDKSKTTKSEFIKLCLEETEKGSQNYKELWTDLGISVDWSKTYSTISPIARKVSQWSLIDLYKKDALYRKESPIAWCPFCQTALAQADLEDDEVDTQLNYINFKAAETGDYLLIATTRPELISACVAMYVHPDDERYTHLIGTKAIVPISEHQVEIKTSEDVDMEFGSGLMMVCTWGDQEDVKKWQRDDLDMRSALNADGTFNELAGIYQGLSVNEVRKRIIEDLKDQNYLVKQEDLTHVVNTHERCGTPMEFILSKQWFIKLMDKKEEWMKFGKQLNWYPEFKFNDYKVWVDSLKWDWCISRQRYYGVPIPVWFCADCDEPHFADEKDLPVDPTEDTPPVTECQSCGCETLIPETDVLDTWATSSCTPFLIRELVDDEKIKEKLYPPTLRPNAFEIIRTWDFYSIVKSYYNYGSIAFEDVMISGHGLDDKGQKISKRLGNYVPSKELLQEYGADAIRFWATGATLGNNLRFNVEEIKRGHRTAMKLWNASKLISMSTEDYDSSGDVSLEHADTWILTELNKTIDGVSQGFEEYSYSRSREILEAFFWGSFADYYLEMVKYRIYGEDIDSKRAAQYTLLRVLHTLLKLYAPIMPFITEELYSLTFSEETDESIHLQSWPTREDVEDVDTIDDFSKVIEAIEEVRKYKSEKGLSLGAELEHYSMQTEIDLKKYGILLSGVTRVKSFTS